MERRSDIVVLSILLLVASFGTSQSQHPYEPFQLVPLSYPTHVTQQLLKGDVFTGMFEGVSDGDGSFEIRAHSPVRGAVTISESGSGPSIGWMTSCDESDFIDCAGSALEVPIFGYLNVSGVGTCDSGNCISPPNEQPGTGCFEYGCWTRECGCDALGSGQGCWGADMRGAIVLVQRGAGVGERVDAATPCTFSLKIWNAQKAGAVAVIVFNNIYYGNMVMMSDGMYGDNITIPAVFVDRSAGLQLFGLVQEAMRSSQAVDVSITNSTESSVRLTVTEVSNLDPGIMSGAWWRGLLEYRIDREVYGSFNVSGQQFAPLIPQSSLRITVRPACPEIPNPPEEKFPMMRPVTECDEGEVIWVVNPGRGARAFGFNAEIRPQGSDGVSFEHLTGHLVDGAGLERHSLRVKMRQVSTCAPEVQSVLECEDEDVKGGEGGCGRPCHVALDDKNYRIFHDGTCEGTRPLMFYCRDKMFCEGTFLVRQDLDTLSRMLPRNWPASEPAPVVPKSCLLGEKNGFLSLGQDDWSADERGSLHMCGYGARIAGGGMCNSLPTKPAGGNPTGWYFNTSCYEADGAEIECGHTGWWMEGDHISSCAHMCEEQDHCDCHVDETISELNLYINLETAGSVGFSYTAHGERYFDYMEFLINDMTAHQTMSFWQTGSYVRSFGMALTSGEHKLTWRWVKDFSMSDGVDRATIHQLVITGLGQEDNACTPCPAGSCGNGGLESCPTCSPSTFSKTNGSKECSACAPAPDSAHHVGPPNWPRVGNTDICGWECSTGYCSSDGMPKCRAGTACPPGQCCASSVGCFLPSKEAVRNGLSPPTLQMLRSCLDLIPVEVENAQSTLDVATRLLGPGGLWKSRDELAPGSATQNKGEFMDAAISRILSNVRDRTTDPTTHIPKVSDWMGVHFPLGQAMRSMLEPGLRYAPPRFYHQISMYLPWSLALAFDDPTTCVKDVGYGKGDVACARIIIKSLNAAAQEFGGDSRHACKCQTCKCTDPSLSNTIPETYIGWTVTKLNLDGGGLTPAVDAVKAWAVTNVGTTPDIGASIVMALASGESIYGGVGANPKEQRYWGPNPRPFSGGQFSCSLTHRNFADCSLPTCTADHCHVTFELRSESGQVVTIDMPWTVSYEGDTAVDCTDVGIPPYDKNVECMRNVVHYGGKTNDKSRSTQAADPIQCSSPRKLDTTWLNAPPKPPLQQLDGECLTRTQATLVPESGRISPTSDGKSFPTAAEAGSTFTVIENGFSSASGYIYQDPHTFSRTGVLALRAFSSEEVAINSILSDFVALEVDSVLVDVRGNPGGYVCHAYELAYLLSSAYGAVDEVRESHAFTVWRSDLMSALGYARGGQGGLGDMCRVVPAKTGDSFSCNSGGNMGLDEALSCGDSKACKGPGAWIRKCSECTGKDGKFSLPFSPVCTGHAFSSGGSLLSFLPGGYCPGLGLLGGGTIKTAKRWPGCTKCLLSGECSSNSRCGFGKGSLLVLSDGRCEGACATFLSVLQAGNHAQILTPGGGFRPIPSLSLGDLTASSEQVMCHLSGAGSVGNLTQDPSLHIATLSLPSKGQEIYFPMGTASVTSLPVSKISWNETTIKALQSFNPPVHFPASRNAARCLPDLYKETIAFSQACSITHKDGRVVDLGTKDSNTRCSVPFSMSATRTCNATCPPEVVSMLCKQTLGADVGNDCEVTCWSPCSATYCMYGFESLWLPASGSSICWSKSFQSGLHFQVGEQMGYNSASQTYGWRAALSGAGAFLLSMLMMFAGGIWGYIAFSPDEKYRKAIISLFTDCSCPKFELPSMRGVGGDPFSMAASLIPKFGKRGGGDSIYQERNEFAGSGGSEPSATYNAM